MYFYITKQKLYVYIYYVYIYIYNISQLKKYREKMEGYEMC